MKHVTILCTASRRRRTISRLRNIGLLHIEQEDQASPVSSKIHTRFTTCGRALQIMRQYRSGNIERMMRHKKTRAREHGAFPGEGIATTAAALAQRMDALQKEGQRIAHYIADLRIWGAFRWETVEKLKQQGLHCHFYSVRKRYLARNPLPQAMTVARQRGRIYFVIVSRTEENEVPLEETILPPHNLEQLLMRQQAIAAEIKGIDTKLARLARLLPTVWVAYQRLRELNQIITARAAFKWAGEVGFVRGFMPARSVAELKRHAKEMKWGLLIRDPLPEEDPPTLVVNPRSVAIISPLYRMLGTVPGYREPDISALFLAFFVLFFAMIIGDAGYALLLIAVALAYRIIARQERHKQGATLLLAVGVATLAWGAVSGNWFGVERIAAWPPTARLIIPSLYTFDTRNIPFVQWICFLIATTHISIARIWRIVYQWRHGYWLQSLSNIGWICLILGLYALVAQLILGAFGFWYPRNILPLLIAGLGGIVVFEQQRRGESFFLGIGRGIVSLFNTLLDGISAFADIISYLRLFAVGLASVEIARSFNQLSGSIDVGALSIVVSILLLFIGHSLNLAMGALSIIVHGVRLNMLEFSSHLGIEWSGAVYRPFSRQTAQ